MQENNSIKYDRQSDSISVSKTDYEVTIEHVSGNLYLLKKYNKGAEPVYVGFKIAKARQFCKEHKLPICGKARVLDILKLMSCQMDPNLQEKIKTVVIPIVEKHNFYEVDFPGAS